MNRSYLFNYGGDQLSLDHWLVLGIEEEVVI